MEVDYRRTIEKELNEKLVDRIIHHKARFKSIFKARYLEMLPSLIKYNGSETVSIDFLKVEVALRNGYDVVIGETKNRKIMILGYANSMQTSENPADLFSTKKLRHADIIFTLPSHLQLDYYREISNDDHCKTGNFVVLRNKTVQYVNDIEIINHYIEELGEIVSSRYSISMQVKISNLFLGDPNDESMLQLIENIYNGNPYIPGSKLFDPEEQIITIKNDGIAQNFQELKREYQNKISELNNAIGINSLAVEKSSGVSDEEAKSNRGYTTSNANINLDGRNHGLKKLNKRYNKQLEAVYNDQVASEFQELIEKEEVSNENNDTI